MALRPEDLDLGPEEVADLVELQRQIDTKLKRFCDGAYWPDPTVYSAIDQRISLTFGCCPGQRVIERCQIIYARLGWDITITTNQDILLMMVGPSPTQASPR